MGIFTNPSVSGVLAAQGQVPQILAQSAVPAGLPSSGTVGANGALSGITAFPTTYSGGIWLYFPAGAVYAGSVAGSYWTVMSSTTAGTVYNNKLTIPGPLTPPASPTPVVDAGPGAYTQTTATNISVFGVTVPGGAMGNNGEIFIRKMGVCFNSAGNKVVDSRINGTAFAGYTFTAQQSFRGYDTLQAAGSNNRQIGNNYCPIGGIAGMDLLRRTYDMSVDTLLTNSLNLSVATDFIIIEATSIQILPSA
jgi:hypothetical protein